LVSKLVPGKADLALNLIGYDDEVTKGMEFIFGNTLICKGNEWQHKKTF